MTAESRDLADAITRLATHIVFERDMPRFRALAKAEFEALGLASPDVLARYFHAKLPEPPGYDYKKHGLSGWISACQFAAFELIYQFGADALPLVRKIAWGEYDWTQGNAIELLIRFAADGIETEAIVAEIKARFPKIRDEAQLYTVGPLLPSLRDPAIRGVFARLMAVPEFQSAYEELTGKADLPPE